MSSPPTITQGAVTTGLTRVFTPATLANLNNLVRVSGGDPQYVSSRWNFYSAARPSGVQLAHWAVEFYHDGSDLAFTAPHPLSGGTSTINVGIIVNDQYVLKSGVAHVANLASTDCFRLAFGSRAVRKIRIEGYSAAKFTSIFVDPRDSVWPTESSVNITVFGDSISASWGTAHEWNGWVPTAEKMLPGANFFSASLPGTGYVTNSTTWKFRDHIVADLAKRPSDVIVFNGGINDGASLTQASVLDCLQLARATAPNATIVVMGVHVASGTGSPTSTDLAAEAKVLAAVTQFADTNCFFLPMNTALSPWQFGSGRVAAPSGNGNADFYSGGVDGTDTIHPNTAGHLNIARRFVSSLDQLVMPGLRLS